MDEPEVGCGPLYECYLAARAGDVVGMREAWRAVETEARSRGTHLPTALAAAVEAGETDRVAGRLAERAFVDDPDDRLEGPLARGLGWLLWLFGYAAAVVLFFRAHSRAAVVGRLRWAYRRVGVDVRAVESVDGVERTVFRCPYRGVGESLWGRRRLCHDVLDRVDDGYVSFLARHRDVDYDRPRPCAGGPCCYSEVREQ